MCRQYLLSRSLNALRTSDHLRDLVDVLASSYQEHGKKVVSALVDLAPRNWTGHQVDTLARSVFIDSSIEGFRTLLSIIGQLHTEFYIERGLTILQSVAPNLPADKAILSQVVGWCAVTVDAYSRRVDLASEALALLLYCSSRLGMLGEYLQGICYRNPGILHTALEIIHQDSRYPGTELSVLAAVHRAVDDWLELCPPQRWKEPAAVPDCIQRLQEQAERWLPPHEATMLGTTVAAYFGLSTLPDSVDQRSKRIWSLLEWLYYQTGMRRQHGKREPELLEEA